MLNRNLLYAHLKMFNKSSKFIEKSKMDATDGYEMNYAYIFLTQYGRNLNKICFCRFSYEQSDAVFSFETKCEKRLLDSNI